MLQLLVPAALLELAECKLIAEGVDVTCICLFHLHLHLHLSMSHLYWAL